MKTFLGWGVVLIFLRLCVADATPIQLATPDCSNLIHLAQGFKCSKLKPRRLAASDWTVFFARSETQKKDQISIRIRPDVDSLRRASSKTIDLLSKLTHPSLPPAPKVFTGSGWIVRIDQGREGRTLKSFVAKKDLAAIQEMSPGFLTSLAKAVDYINTRGLVVAGLTTDFIEVKQTGGNVEAYLPDLDYTVDNGTPFDIRGDWRYWDLTRYPPYAQKGTFSPDVDSYAIGVLLYVLLHQGRFPFDVKDRNNYFKLLNKGEFTIDAGVQPEFAILIAELMRQKAGKRLSAGDIVKLCREVQKNKAAVLQESLKVSVDEELPITLWQKAHPGFVRRLMEVRNGETSEEDLSEEEKKKLKRSDEFKAIVFWVYFGVTMVGFVVYYVWRMMTPPETKESDWFESGWDLEGTPNPSNPNSNDPDDPLEGIRSLTPAERRKAEHRVASDRKSEPKVDSTSLIRIEEASMEHSSGNFSATLNQIQEL